METGDYPRKCSLLELVTHAEIDTVKLIFAAWHGLILVVKFQHHIFMRPVIETDIVLIILGVGAAVDLIQLRGYKSLVGA